jgi:hypothetical protein
MCFSTSERSHKSNMPAYNHFNIEHGTPPHIRIDMSEADRAQGKDSILERTLAELR